VTGVKPSSSDSVTAVMMVRGGKLGEAEIADNGVGSRNDSVGELTKDDATLGRVTSSRSVEDKIDVVNVDEGKSPEGGTSSVKSSSEIMSGILGTIEGVSSTHSSRSTGNSTTMGELPTDSTSLTICGVEPTSAVVNVVEDSEGHTFAVENSVDWTSAVSYSDSEGMLGKDS
jgi:hypothetical protein